MPAHFSMNEKAKFPLETAIIRVVREHSKAARRAIRELASLAYERELLAELFKLQGKFDEWRRQELDAFALEKASHAIHNGPARDLFNRYSSGSILDQAVAGAVLHGAVREEEVPEIVRDHITRLVAVFRSLE